MNWSTPKRGVPTRVPGRRRSLPAVLLLLSVFLGHSARAQSAGKYDFYRWPKYAHAIQLNPLGQLLGRLDAHFEQRLDPNFSRTYEFAYQKNLRSKGEDSLAAMPAYTFGVTERIYLIDDGAIVGQFAGLGVGVGTVGPTIAVRLSAELGYKWIFGNGHFFVEPLFLMDSYLISNHHARRILPYLALPIGYSW